MGALFAIDPHEGPLDGGHRLTVTLEQPSERWPLVAQALEADLEDSVCSLGWEPMLRLFLAGYSAAGTVARFYLVGSIMNWAGLAACNITPPPLTRFERVLGVALPGRAFKLERRKLEIATYDHITGGKPWPFRWEGCAAARRVNIQGQVDAGQLRGLCRMLRAAVRRGAWAEGGLPGVQDVAILEGDTIVLPRQIGHSELIETVFIWSQVFWVDVKVVRWTPF